MPSLPKALCRAGELMGVLREAIAAEIATLQTHLQPDYDPHYHELLKGKKIAVAGPAETVIGTGQGDLIDSYDLVVRFNTVIRYLPFTDELAHDIGTRTDILYANNEVVLDGIVGQRDVSHSKFAELCDQLAIKYIVSTNNNFSYSNPSQARQCLADGETVKRFLRDHEIRTAFRMLFATSELASRWLSGYIARTGFLAILDLLAYDVSELYITGMTFYHQGGHLFLADHASELHPLKNHRGELPKDGIMGHNSYFELEAMRSLGASLGEKLKFDARLQELMEDHSGE
jgi:glycosyl transferase family 29 (putative sialyltransferase)